MRSREKPIITQKKRGTKERREKKRHLLEVGRVVDFSGGNESLLDTPGLDESVEDGGGSSLVVGSRSSCSSERLLANDGTG